MGFFGDGLVLLTAIKTSLATKGSSQIPHEDYFFDIFSALVKPIKVDLLFSLALSHDWIIFQLDEARKGLTDMHNSQIIRTLNHQVF